MPRLSSHIGYRESQKWCRDMPCRTGHCWAQLAPNHRWPTGPNFDQSQCPAGGQRSKHPMWTESPGWADVPMEIQTRSVGMLVGEHFVAVCLAVGAGLWDAMHLRLQDDLPSCPPREQAAKNITEVGTQSHARCARLSNEETMKICYLENPNCIK